MTARAHITNALRKLPALALLLAFTAFTGCAGDLPPEAKTDSSPWSYPDTSAWPDGTKSNGTDSWSWPADGYPGGAPFGCSTDAACFGLRCCPTPWGLKVCAEHCS